MKSRLVATTSSTTNQAFPLLGRRLQAPLLSRWNAALQQRDEGRGGFTKRHLTTTSPSAAAAAAASSGHKPRVAVLLSGCGVFDGSEIQEASSVLIHLSRHDAQYSCFAPNASFAVYNHATDEQSKETRNALEEAARISRGQIRDLEQLVASEFDALIIPGGYGVAKTLSSFASEGENCNVRADVQEAITDFLNEKKPIGMCCIAPVLAAKTIPGAEVTLGNSKDMERTVMLMGAKHVEKAVTEIHVDTKHKLVTTPAYMSDAALPHQIYDGIGKMVDKVLHMLKKASKMD
jgi:enhancing lycopene biosynthesis protein 2